MIKWLLSIFYPFVKQWITLTIVIVCIDLLFMFFMKSTYSTLLKGYIHLDKGTITIVWPSALVAWMLISAGILIFVIPIVTHTHTHITALYGALFGIIIYGTYETTNYALIYQWPLPMVLIDTLWGTVLTTIATIIAKKYLQ